MSNRRISQVASAMLCTSVLSLAVAETGQTTVIGLQGYSPVSYLDDNRAEPGSPRFTVEHAGITYFLTSAKQAERFRSSPERYLPAYGGYCAYGCAVDGKFTPDPTNFKVIAGRTHLFLRNDQLDTKLLWEKEDYGTIKRKADRFWQQQTQSRAYLGAQNLPASGVALEGYSPVSYFVSGRAEPGDPRFQAVHNGATYLFTSAEQMKQFQENPARYEPAFGGWCAFGMAVRDKFPVDPTRFKIVDGRLFLFLKNETVDALELWQKENERTLTAKADEHWRKVSGS